MLDDPRMTNSTFIEGYASTGELHYAPYTNDPRVSFAHGWATGPTSTLTFLVAGLQITAAGGRTWKVAPMLGDLEKVEAGFSTSLGWFEVKTKVDKKGDVSLDFETPEGTSGSVEIDYPACAGKMTLHSVSGTSKDVIKNFVAKKDGGDKLDLGGVIGGRYQLRLTCS